MAAKDHVDTLTSVGNPERSEVVVIAGEQKARRQESGKCSRRVVVGVEVLTARARSSRQRTLRGRLTT
jgi:hypothetical protein